MYYIDGMLQLLLLLLLLHVRICGFRLTSLIFQLYQVWPDLQQLLIC